MFDPATSGYPLEGAFDKTRLDRLLRQFEDSVKRDVDRKLAEELRVQLLQPSTPTLRKATFERLARWCKTDGIYGEGMDIAQRISELLFGRVLNRTDIGT
jgi:hypothetical protein